MTQLPFTQLPNALVDLMPGMSEAELRVVLAVCRKTVGWHKPEDVISLSQFAELTGMSEQGATNGIKRAIERGLIARRRVGRGYAYHVVLVAAAAQAGAGWDAPEQPPNAVGGSSLPEREAAFDDPAQQPGGAARSPDDVGITRHAVEETPNLVGRAAWPPAEAPRRDVAAPSPGGGQLPPRMEATPHRVGVTPNAVGVTPNAVEGSPNGVGTPSPHGVGTQKKGVVVDDDTDIDLSGYHSQQHVSFVPQRGGANTVEANAVGGNEVGDQRGEEAGAGRSRRSRRDLDPKVYAALLAASVWPPKAGELAARCNLGDVEAWIRYVKEVPSLENPGAMLVELLECDLEPPAWARRGYSSPEEDPERYVTGPYADYIEH